MGTKIIVLNMYGKDEIIENISVSLFDGGEQYYSNNMNNALNYCKNINDLELKDNHWIHAEVVKENEKITLKRPLKFDIINRLHDRSLEKVLREVNRADLAKSLIDIDKETKEKILKNLSQRSAKMLTEDIEALHEIGSDDIKLSQNKIIEIIQHLNSTGEIII